MARSYRTADSMPTGLTPGMRFARQNDATPDAAVSTAAVGSTSGGKGKRKAANTGKAAKTGKAVKTGKAAKTTKAKITGKTGKGPATPQPVSGISKTPKTNKGFRSGDKTSPITDARFKPINPSKPVGGGGVMAPGNPSKPVGGGGVMAPGKPSKPVGGGGVMAPGKPSKPVGGGGVMAPGKPPHISPAPKPMGNGSSTAGKQPVTVAGFKSTKPYKPVDGGGVMPPGKPLKQGVAPVPSTSKGQFVTKTRKR